MRTENKYGKALSKKDIITIILNRAKGTISYKINKHDYGVAFQDDVFKVSTLYFAISMYVKDQKIAIVDSL